jgi:hypothetical protein
MEPSARESTATWRRRALAKLPSFDLAVLPDLERRVAEQVVDVEQLGHEAAVRVGRLRREDRVP